jgi:hypothetical protein
MEIEALERQFRQAEISHHHTDGINIPEADAASVSLPDLSGNGFLSQPASPAPSKPAVSPILAEKITPSEIRKLHHNLEARLQPFWSSTLSGRTIRLSIRLVQTNNDSQTFSKEFIPIASRSLVTEADGSFMSRLKISWEDLCEHASAMQQLSRNPFEANELLVIAELDQLPIYQQVLASSDSITHAKIYLPLSDANIRVISDIDDTVKISNILSGARTVFHHVFVKDLKELVVPVRPSDHRFEFDF